MSDTRTRYLGSKPVKLFRILVQGNEAVRERPVYRSFRCVFLSLGLSHVQPKLAQLYLSRSFSFDSLIVWIIRICLGFCLGTMSWRYCRHRWKHIAVRQRISPSIEASFSFLLKNFNVGKTGRCVQSGDSKIENDSSTFDCSSWNELVVSDRIGSCLLHWSDETTKTWTNGESA